MAGDEDVERDRIGLDWIGLDWTREEEGGEIAGCLTGYWTRDATIKRRSLPISQGVTGG